ncbi:MAG: alpha/beta hydrolase [Acidimicrobiia bacterium]|nr:alpha/beta hydrolase [Acidimicrobiia bacterium]
MSHTYADIAFGLLHHKDYGGNGEAIVLVHGLGGSAVTWDALGPHIARFGRAMAVDLPGFGLSPPGLDWSLETHSEALADYIDHVGPPATVVANSMGALISERVAADHPNLVSRLVLISPATPPRFPDPRLDWPTAWRLALQATPGVGRLISKRFISAYSPREMVRVSLQMITHHAGNVPLEVQEALTALAARRRHLPWAADAVPSTATQIAKLFARPWKFVEMIRDIVAPTLVVQGTSDHIVSPTAVEWMCSLRPDWTLVQLENTGHTPQLDAPVRLVSVIGPWLGGAGTREFSA